MNKISQYFSTLELTRGFLIALLTSAYIYMEYWGISHPLFTTLFGILALYFLLEANKKVWFLSGAFIGLFWFWWFTVSFIYYEMLWAIPIALLLIALIQGGIFWIIAWSSEKVTMYINVNKKNTQTLLEKPTLPDIIIKATGLLLLSYIHPFGFDWFKPELMFVNSYIGIEKWQYAVVLTAIVLSIWKKQLLFMFLILLAYQPVLHTTITIPESIRLITTHTNVKDKWNKKLHKEQFSDLLHTIDIAIQNKKKLIIFPESVFPVFLNHKKRLMKRLKQRSYKISIVLGSLYWKKRTPYNSAYIFTKGKVTIANKVILVPFGEKNPLPDFLSDWVNEVFYDGAVDYKASENVVDYTIHGVTYRNAICFEATSEKLYEGKPKNMIVLSNNGWFMPSIEPTLQRLLLQYYSKKYGTTIYHSINMSPSYIIKDGNLAEQ